jgi:hypothetical protein
MRSIIKFSGFAALLLLIPVITYSQQFIKVVKSEFKTENETGLKEAWKSIKEGDKLFNVSVHIVRPGSIIFRK